MVNTFSLFMLLPVFPKIDKRKLIIHILPKCKWGHLPPESDVVQLPSIHFLYPLNLSVGSWGGLEPIPAAIGREAGYTLDRSSVHHRATQRQTRQTTTHMLTLTPKDNSETPINLTCMFLDGGRKPEYPERTHAYTGRTCKLYTERSQPGVEPGTELYICMFH